MSNEDLQNAIHRLGNRLTVLSGKIRKIQRISVEDEHKTLADRSNELVEECVALCHELRKIEQSGNG